MKRIDISLQRFGRLVAISYAGKIPAGKAMHTAWRCRCDCGKEVVIETQKLRSLHTRSCGCLAIDVARTIRIKHGQAIGKVITQKVGREYQSWASAKDRCHNKNNSSYHLYGKRGIKMCEEWRKDFNLFWNELGPRPHGTTLDRIDNNKGYEPGNCRWVTKKIQNRNRRNNLIVDAGNGNKICLKDFATMHNISYGTIYRRYKEGRSLL